MDTGRKCGVVRGLAGLLWKAAEILEGDLSCRETESIGGVLPEKYRV